MFLEIFTALYYNGNHNGRHSAILSRMNHKIEKILSTTVVCSYTFWWKSLDEFSRICWWSDRDENVTSL